MTRILPTSAADTSTENDAVKPTCKLVSAMVNNPDY